MMAGGGRRMSETDYNHYWIGDEDALPKRGPGRGFDGEQFLTQSVGV